MGCPCHGNSRINAEVVFAQEQCWWCCRKHVIIAWTLWNEFNYQTLNLASIEGNLRLAIQHIQYMDKDVAMQIRGICLDIEKGHLEKVTEDRWDDLINVIQERIYLKFPDMRQRIDEFIASNH